MWHHNTGKTRALLEKLHLAALKYPGMRGLAVRKTRASLTQSVLVTFEQCVVPLHDPILSGPDKGHRVSYKYSNGSELVLGGLDDADRIMSSEYDLIGVFEATEVSEDDWEKLQTRLRHGVMPYQQIVADCNPQGPSHWLNQRAGTTRMRRLLTRHVDNPTVTPEYLALLDKLTGVRRDRLFLGKWVAAEGVVYPEFDRARHVIDRLDIPADWRRFRVVDFGYTNPFVCQWWAVDGDGRAYLYREIYQTQTLVEDQATHIKALSQGEECEATIADHDAEDRATLQRHGIGTVAARKDVAPGLEVVRARLRVAGDGKPRLFILADALVAPDAALRSAGRPTSTLNEFDCYVWPKARDGKLIKEVPVKVDDHGMDAMRYGMMYLDAGPMLDVRVTSTRVRERDADED